MKCRKVWDNLSAYADGELGEKLRRRVEKHLGVCERCATELSRLEEVTEAAKRSLMNTVSAKLPPDDLRDRVMRSTESVRGQRVLLVSVRRLAMAAVLVALASGLLAWMLTDRASRFQRESLLRRVTEKDRALAIAKGDLKGAHAELMELESRLKGVQRELLLASARRATEDEFAERAPSRLTWPPMLSSLDIPDAENLLKNGFF